MALELDSKLSSEESMHYEKENINKTLEDCPNKNFFLFKFGLLNCLYFSSGLFVNFMLLYFIQYTNE